MPAALELITEHPNAYGRALAVAPDGHAWATCDGLRATVMDARSRAGTLRLTGRSAVEGRSEPRGRSGVGALARA